MNFETDELLKYPASEQDAIEIQQRWVEFIKKENAPNILLEDISIVAGVDLSYVKEGESEYGIACAVLWDVQKKKEISHKFAIEEVKFPYISGLLAFREIRIATKTLENLFQIPDIIMFDGHGLAHPRRFGAAVAIGVAMNIPSIGIAKNPIYATTDWKTIERRQEAKLPVVLDGDLVGYVIVLKDNASPVFISAGYKID